MASENSVSETLGRVEVLREALTMVLYLSIVLLAALTALPTELESAEDGHGAGGVHGLGLVGLIWGTTIGLALAHWFAFRLSARAFGGGQVSQRDIEVGLAQVGGAVLVAVLCTIPALVFDDAGAVPATTWVPALLVGATGYLVARVSHRPKLQALVIGGVVLFLGLAVAAVKNFLIGH